jgi:hypothetical protein
MPTLIEAHPEFMNFAVLTGRKSRKATAAGGDLSSFWS